MTIDAILTSPALAGMRAVRQWIVYRVVPSEKRPGKLDKIPYSPHTGKPVGVNDPAGWADIGTAAAAARAWGEGFGLGFCFTPDCGYWFLDLDGCRLGDAWSPLAQAMVAQVFPGAAVEISVSGKGLHLFGRGQVPPHSNRNGEHSAEFYTADRFCAMSGTSLQGNCDTDHTAVLSWFVGEYFPPREAAQGAVLAEGPRPGWNGPADDDELIRRALQSRSAAAVFGGSKASFADLWTADERALAAAFPPGNAYDPFDRSRADASLAQRLAFWTGADHQRVADLMRQSALVREKWERDDYFHGTIINACAQQRDVYCDPKALVEPAEPTTAGEPAPYVPLFSVAHHGGKASLENVFDTLQSPQSGVRIGLDTFLERIVIAGADERWRMFTDADYGRLRAEFGRRGFKPISAEIMRTAVMMAADDNKFDSAKQWAATLHWDGTPRIERALPTYYRTADTDYTRAVGLYVFTAMAGRLLSPGCQADMVMVLVGLQGERKTSAVRALCPDPAFFGEINLKRIDDKDLSRHIRGKLIGEIAELRGLVGRDQESVKAWVTRREETWRPNYCEFETTYPRRLVFVGTTNESEFLDDPTGERRWLPVTAGTVDVEAIERDRDQLWAEGIERYKAEGILWREAERLARGQHAQFKVVDPWHDDIELWLSTKDSATGRPHGDSPFKLAQVLAMAVGKSGSSVDMKDARRAGKVLRALGYDKAAARNGQGAVGKWWQRAVPPVASA